MKKKTIDGLHALLKDGQADQRDAISSGQQPCRAQRQWYARTDRPLLSIRRSAHELVGHSIPAVISPSDYDSRMDGLAVTSENIIRKETMSPLRPWNTYSKNDWSVNGMTYSLSLVLIRTLFPKINCGQ